jgi:outer membrane protein assembly factor BamB
MCSNRTILSSLLVIAALFGIPHPLFSAENAADGSDWVNWKGPYHNGFSPEKGLLREWPKGGPAVVWRVPIEQGWSCPVVSGNDVYLSAAKFLEWNKAEETISCLDAKTGAKRWEHKYVAFPYYCGWSSGGPRATPVVTEKYVISIGMIGHVFCLDRKTGAVVWKHELMQEYKDVVPIGKDSEWKGWNISPTVVGKTVYVSGPNSTDTPYGVNGLYAGFDVNDGKQLWIHYLHEDGKGKLLSNRWSERVVSEALPIRFQNQDCLLNCANQTIMVLNPQDGKELTHWNLQTHPAFNGGIPTVMKDGAFLSPGGLGEWILYDVDRNPPFKSTVRWKKNFQADWAYGLTEYDGYLYGAVLGGTNANAVSESSYSYGCVDLKTGDVKWSQPGFQHGSSHIVADGLFIIRSYQTIQLAEAVPTGFVEKGRIEKIHADTRRGVAAAQGLTDWVQPILSHGKMYIRTPGELICYQISDQKAKTGH